jgi:hypothetical protein
MRRFLGDLRVLCALKCRVGVLIGSRGRLSRSRRTPASSPAASPSASRPVIASGTPALPDIAAVERRAGAERDISAMNWAPDTSA